MDIFRPLSLLFILFNNIIRDMRVGFISVVLKLKTVINLMNGINECFANLSTFIRGYSRMIGIM